MDGLDLSILDSMNIPNIETKTTRKETINMPENVDTESDQDSAPISEAEEVDSYEELIKKQNAEDTTRTVVDDETEEDNDEVDDDHADCEYNPQALKLLNSSLSKLSLEISNELSSGENIFDAEMSMKQRVIGNITAVVDETIVFSLFYFFLDVKYKTYFINLS